MDNNIYQREKKPYYIYIHTCPNRKVYIGLSKNPMQRWNNGEGYKSNIEFYEDIKKFGWNNIQHEIIATTYYGWVARKIEKTTISKFKASGKIYNKNNEDRVGYISQRKIPLKAVGQFNKKTGELIRKFKSIREARDYTGIPEQGIRASCLNIIKTSGGYIWKYL